MSKQVVNFYNRLENLNAANTPSLVRHAFVEQRTNNLTWHKNMTALLHLAGHTTQTLASPEGVRMQLQNYFDNLWDEQRKISKKLSFYNQVKKPSKIEFEPYLNLKDERERKSLMRLRSSSHRLHLTKCLRVLRDAAASQLYKHLSINSDTCERARARTADNCGVGDVAAARMT